MTRFIRILWLFFLALTIHAWAHEGEDHSKDVEPKLDGPIIVEPMPKFKKTDWSKVNMVGIPPIMNTADLERTHRKHNPLNVNLIPEPEPCKKWHTLDMEDTDMYYIDRILDSRGMRAAPFPNIMCFIDGTDYYQHRTEIQQKIIGKIKDSSGETRLKYIDEFAWLLLYLGEFEEITKRYGENGEFQKHLQPEDLHGASLSFALGQAYFRLGKYEQARPYIYKAYHLLPGANLDTRWQYMLIELSLEGPQFLDTPDSSVYSKKYIHKIFPNRDFSSFPFVDVTEEMGIERWGGTGSVSFADMDQDGWDDLIWERKFMPAQIYRNIKGQNFEAIPAKDLKSPQGTPIILTPADIDNDGLPDLYRHCCNYDGPGPSQVLKNKGNMVFEDITDSSGLYYDKASGMAVAWADYDLDGYLDIVIADANGPNRLYRNKGDGSFENTTEKAGLKTARTVGISFGDFDNDGWPDIWALGWDNKWLYKNNGDGTFTDVTEERGLGDNLGQKGYMSFMFDYDNDGHMDLFAGQYVVASDEKWGFSPICSCSNLLSDEGYSDREWRSATTIFRNKGDNTFENVSEKTNFIPLGMMGSNHGDWNNDGYEDLFFGSGGPFMQQAEPYTFYQNNGDGTFTNITPFEMIGLFGKGHGSAFADFNHDGFLDLATNNGGAAPGDLWPSMLLKNKGNDNNWIYISLNADQPDTNSLGVGARVTVYAGEKQLTKELQAGGQFGATNSFLLHFGLAKENRIDKIVVRWPNKGHEKTIIRNVTVNRAVEITQSDNSIKRLWK